MRLPNGCAPRRPPHLRVRRIVLAKGSVETPERRRFVERICELYTEADILDQTNTPHNRIDLGREDALERHRLGKHTLVFGELRSAVRFSEEEGNTCPNYWHFSPYGFCPYGCKYCYLAGTPGVWFSPTIKIYVNLVEIMETMDQRANALAKPVPFYLGKLQDGLALDPLTAYSTLLIPFFAGHPYARQVLLTKSASVERLLDLDHQGHTTLSWSLNPPEIVREFEENTPRVQERIEAMRLCAERGYPVRAVIMPVIPVHNWESVYVRFVKELLNTVPVERLTLGGICIYRNALRLMERKIGVNNSVSELLDCGARLADGRRRFPAHVRLRLYGAVINAAKEASPETELALCLEEPDVWRKLGIEERVGKCNCVL